MAGALRKTMYLLGLAEDEGYDQYDEQDDYARSRAGDSYDEDRESRENRYEREEPREHRADVTPLQRVPAARIVREPVVGGIARITTIAPRTYNEARAIGEAFRESIPVIMNLTDLEDADAKRLVDFAAGLVFGLRGSIEKVTSKVFLLTPETVEVEGGADAGPSHRGLFNQG